MSDLLGWLMGSKPQQETDQQQKQQQADKKDDAVSDSQETATSEQNEATADKPSSSEQASSAQSQGSEDAKPKELQSSEMLTAEQVMRFIVEYERILATDEGKGRLREAVLSGKQPEVECEVIQAEVFETLGIKGSHGIACLSKVVPTFRAINPGLIVRFQLFVERESLACDEAELSPEEFEAKKAAYQQAQQQRQAMAVQMMQRMMADPDSQRIMLERARQYAQQQQAASGAPAPDPMQQMQAAMQRLAVAQQQMAAQGLKPEDLIKQAMTRLADPNAPLPSVSDHEASVNQTLLAMQRAQMNNQAHAHGHSHAHGHGHSQGAGGILHGQSVVTQPGAMTMDISGGLDDGSSATGPSTESQPQSAAGGDADAKKDA